MGKQLKIYTNAMNEEGQAKFIEACEYIKGHCTPESRQYMIKVLDE